MNGAGEGNRTLVSALGRPHSTIEPHPPALTIVSIRPADSWQLSLNRLQVEFLKPTSPLLRQPTVATVTERAGLGMFAATPRHGFFLGDVHFGRREARTFVRTIAERLAFGLAARAPVETAGFHFQDVGRFLGDDRFTHTSFVAADLDLANKIIPRRHGL